MSASEGPSLKQAAMACRSLVLQSLWGLVHEALHDSAASIDKQLQASTRSDQRAILRDAATLAGPSAETLAQRWVDAFMQRFDSAMIGSASPGRGAGVSASTESAAAAGIIPGPVLSLLSDDELHDSLERDRMAQRVSSRIDAEALAAVRARLAALAGRDEFPENDHPLSPASLFDALDQAAIQCQAERQTRLLLMEEVALDLPSRWERLIQDTQALLLAQGVMPRLRPAGSRKEARMAPAPRSIASVPPPSGMPAGSAASRFGMHGFAATASAGAVASLGLSGRGAQVEQLQGALQGARLGQAGAHRQVLQALVDEQQLGALETAIAPVQLPLLDSLSELQRQWQGEITPVSLAGIAEQLHRNGTVLDQVTADIVSMVFDYIDADRRLADSVKRQLLRLQVVAIKAALLDRAFFARRQHPLRQLIDVVSDAGADPEADVGTGSILLSGLRDMVDQVIGQFGTSLEVFEEAIREVQRLVEAEAQRHQHEREQAEQDAVRREALAMVAEQARTALVERIDEQTPEEVRQFLLAHWTRLMIRTRLLANAPGAAGQASSAGRNWEVSLRTAELLLWSCQPKQADEIARLAQILPVLLRAIQQGMQAIELPIPEREAFLSFLMQTHTREIGLARRRPLEPEDRKPALIRMGGDGVVRFDASVRAGSAAWSPPGVGSTLKASQGTVVLAAQSAILSALARGARYELATAEGARQAKLAWISPAKRLFIFSAHPEFNLTLAAEEVEQQLRSGQLRPLDPSPSVQGILDQLMQPETEP